MGYIYIRPDSDLDRASWVTGTGGTTNLYRQIDETSLNASDYIHGYQTSGIAKFSLSNPSTTPPTDTNHTLRVYGRRFSGSSTTFRVTVTLKQGSTTIASSTLTFSGSGSTQTIALSEAEAATISDYTDLRIWFDPSPSSSATTQGMIGWFEFELPEDQDSIALGTAAWAWSAAYDSFGTGITVDLGTAAWAWSASYTEVSVPQPNSTWRDVFCCYNPSTEMFHVGQTKTTHNPEAGAGTISEVESLHFALSLRNRALWRFAYTDSFLSALCPTTTFLTSEREGNYNDRPDSVLAGFWSYGSFPSYDNTASALIYEASIARDDSSVATTNGFPTYGGSSPAEDCYFVLPAHDFRMPGVHKVLRRITLWVVPREGTGNTSVFNVSVTPHPTNAQAGVAETFTRTLTVTGYDSGTTLNQPTKVVYADFDPSETTGEGFEIKVAMTNSVGIRRVMVDVDPAGEADYLDYQAP